MSKARERLQTIYGYDDFRDAQKPIINAILAHHDTLAIMPTGGGKSMCYQIPALLHEGITLVISPLISLMQDQVAALQQLGISAAYLNSTLTVQRQEDVYRRLKQQDIKLLYVAPERLSTRDFITLMQSLPIFQVAVDEAHCLSNWGHDFRPSYQKIAPFIAQLPKRPIVTAFTATATDDVQQDIVKLLHLRDPQVFHSGFDRPNLTLRVEIGASRLPRILSYLEAHSGESGIIYAPTRQEVDQIYEQLKQSNVSVGRYHAGLSDTIREKEQHDFLYDQTLVMVATNAFGMGIDKSNVRFVLHAGLSKNMESYYQEIGRAGRDGERADCLLLFSQKDIQTQRYLIEQSVYDVSRQTLELKRLQSLVDYVYAQTCLRQKILGYFGEDLKAPCGNCSVCLDEREVVDQTVAAQMILSCIAKMKRPFGMIQVIDVLRGANTEKIRQFNFQTLSTYGLMKHYSKDELRLFIQTLIALGFVNYEGQYPVLTLNEQSVSILRSSKQVLIKQPKQAVVAHQVDDELFETLKQIRLQCSSSEGVPPYFIFSDATLRDMARRMPQTEAEFLDISGVGALKATKYGPLFLTGVSDYVQAHALKVSFAFNQQPSSSSSKKQSTKEVTLMLLRQGLDVLEVAHTRQLSVSTICTHITALFDEGVLDCAVQVDSIVSEADIDLISTAITKLGAQQLRPLKEALPEAITYDQIRVVLTLQAMNKLKK